MKIGSFFPPSPRYKEGYTLDDNLKVVPEVRAYLKSNKPYSFKGVEFSSMYGKYRWQDNAGDVLYNVLY
jgi:hypothetical protein